ncbi:glycosyltransferase family 2 protein [Candidatus Gottesmanbacteria bacterium]|nr:glycosyltransferase family 2 protein [Candidatus Gottesmanbacteria bacterium]
MSKQISIIIPAYNEEKYISHCLGSISKQTVKPFNVIVIDDGSTDSTSSIARKYEVEIYKINHSGPGNAKNYGASKARGEILVFIDADMLLDKNYIKNITAPIIKGKCLCTYTTEEYVQNMENIWAKCWNINSNLPFKRRVNIDREYKELAFRAILKKTFEQTSGYNSAWGYFDDGSLSKFGVFAKAVNNAICYHYNPDTLKDVFFSARWIGRSNKLNLSIRNILRYSILNSLKIAYRNVINGAPFLFVVFKVIFDFGIVVGMFTKMEKYNYAK